MMLVHTFAAQMFKVSKTMNGFLVQLSEGEAIQFVLEPTAEIEINVEEFHAPAAES